MKHYGLKGFSSGMFISEVAEAKMYGMQVPRTQVEVSNYAFAVTLGRILASGREMPKNIYEYVTEMYLDESDGVITFNNKAMIYV